MALSTINATTGLTDGTVTSAKLADFAAAVDLNGVELILDADQDTSITADTDDRIDFKIAGVEHFSFSNSSGDTIIKPMVDAKDIKLQQFDGRTLLDINDAGFVGIENGATGPGAIRIFEDTDNGSNYVGLSVGNVSTSYTLVFPNADGSSGQVMTTNGSGVLSFADASANTPSSADGQALGSASLEWSDLFLADASTIQFGADQDVILTHVADTGVLLNAASVIQFRDSAINIGSPADGDLDINADDEIELNSTLIDINGNVEISGTLTQTGVGTFAAIPVFSAGINVSGGTIAGTIATATQNSITTMTGLVTTGALDTGSITSGFGNIDNGASNITNGGLVKLDVDSDADDVTGDSATGRLTIGAGEDLNLYHGGTNSYVVNDTGLLVLQSAGGVVVNENSANVDFRVESNGDANMLVVDGSTNRIGMGVAAPSSPLHIFQAGSNNATTELLLLETGSSTDGSGVKLRMATADTSGIMEMADGTGSFDSEFRFKLSDSSQLATPDTKFTIAPQFATFAVDARFIDGAVASPSICNDGDTNTGIFFRAGDCMSFATEGILALDINDDQRISTGAETGPDVGAGGICIDQNGVDDAFLSVKSSDIAHGMTGVMETDSVMRFKKASANNGGIEATFVTGGGNKALDIVGVAVTPSTAEATNTDGVLHFNSKKKDGTGTQALGADDNAQVFLNNGVVQFIIKGDGELFSNQSATVGTFDTFEDAQLVRAHDLFHKTGVIDSKFDKFIKYNEKTLADNHLIGKDENGNPTPMVNVTGMQRLHNGAIWQQYEKTERLTMAMYELAKEAIGEEKAKAILEKHEVKLLN